MLCGWAGILPRRTTSGMMLGGGPVRTTVVVLTPRTAKSGCPTEEEFLQGLKPGPFLALNVGAEVPNLLNIATRKKANDQDD